MKQLTSIKCLFYFRALTVLEIKTMNLLYYLLYPLTFLKFVRIRVTQWAETRAGLSHPSPVVRIIQIVSDSEEILARDDL